MWESRPDSETKGSIIMSRTVRLSTLAAAATASLALAGNALAKPQLLVRGASATGASGATVVEVKEAKEDAAPARIAIYIPPGYAASTTQAPGTQIGTVHADLQALAISPDAIIQADGTLLTADPSTFLTNTCAPGMHAAVWLLHVSVTGQTIDVPVYVDPTSGAEAALGVTKLVLCLSNPYEQATPPTSRAPFGVKIIDARLTLAAGTITNPAAAGPYLWRTVITPWTINGATPNAVGTFEAQSLVNLPIKASLSAKVKTTRRVTRVRGKRRVKVANSVLLSGRLLEILNGVPGAKVAFFANGKSAGTATTNASGTFTRTMALARKTAFRASIVVPVRNISCITPLPATSAPGGCVSATLSGYTITTATVVATPKR
jgi:hypothetical protein